MVAGALLLSKLALHENVTDDRQALSVVTVIDLFSL